MFKINTIICDFEGSQRIYWYITTQYEFYDRGIAEDILKISIKKYRNMIKKVSNDIFDNNELYFRQHSDALKALEIVKDFYDQMMVMKKLTEKY